jgi:hypothetical protein
MHRASPHRSRTQYFRLSVLFLRAYWLELVKIADALASRPALHHEPAEHSSLIGPRIIEVGRRDTGYDRHQVRWSFDRRLPLRHTEVRAAHHADLAGGPGLTRGPLNRVVSIVAFLDDRAKCAFGPRSPADFLVKHHVAPTLESGDSRRVSDRPRISRSRPNGPTAHCKTQARELSNIIRTIVLIIADNIVLSRGRLRNAHRPYSHVYDADSVRLPINTHEHSKRALLNSISI